VCEKQWKKGNQSDGEEEERKSNSNTRRKKIAESSMETRKGEQLEFCVSREFNFGLEFMHFLLALVDYHRVAAIKAALPAFDEIFNRFLISFPSLASLSRPQPRQLNDGGESLKVSLRLSLSVCGAVAFGGGKAPRGDKNKPLRAIAHDHYDWRAGIS
jgi:hypothetical protein